MLEGLASDTHVIVYLMAGIGVLGVVAKVINQITLYRLVRAAGNMPKSTHRLIKLVRAKYEHACMIRDSVENIDAFVEKYIYEYRGFLFRIHTWRQIEMISVWLAGLLAALGASVLYFSSGFSESVYQYIAAGIAEAVLLWAVMHLTDEPYKVNAVRMYMVDYLENICTFRLRRQNSKERETIDVIAAEGSAKSAQSAEETAGYSKQEYTKQEQRLTGRAARNARAARAAQSQPAPEPAYAAGASKTEDAGRGRNLSREERGTSRYEKADRIPEVVGAAMDAEANASLTESRAQDRERKESGLSINIEGEPRSREKGEAARQAVRHAAQGASDDGRPALREEAIRQILEEFLA